MDPKSARPLRIFNPLSIWTDFALKSGGAMLTAAQAAVARKVPKVAVIRDADAQPPKKSKAARAKAPKAAKARTARKTARKSASSRAKRRGR